MDFQRCPGDKLDGFCVAALATLLGKVEAPKAQVSVGTHVLRLPESGAICTNNNNNIQHLRFSMFFAKLKSQNSTKFLHKYIIT